MVPHGKRGVGYPRGCPPAGLLRFAGSGRDPQRLRIAPARNGGPLGRNPSPRRDSLVGCVVRRLRRPRREWRLSAHAG